MTKRLLFTWIGQRNATTSLWNPDKIWKFTKKTPKQKTKRLDSGEREEEEIRVSPFPLLTADNPTAVNESTTPQNPALDTTDTDRRTLDTPSSSKDDPSYYPLDTPRSWRELHYAHRTAHHQVSR